jgi:hypothetical protein
MIEAGRVYMQELKGSLSLHIDLNASVIDGHKGTKNGISIAKGLVITKKAMIENSR